MFCLEMMRRACLGKLEKCLFIPFEAMDEAEEECFEHVASVVALVGRPIQRFKFQD